MVQPMVQPMVHPMVQPQVTSQGNQTFSDNIPVRPSPSSDGRNFTPVYDYYVGADGMPYKVLRQPAPVPAPQFRMEYRCNPATGEVYQVRVSVTPGQELRPVQIQPSSHTPNQTQDLPWQSMTQQTQQGDVGGE